MRLGTLLVLSWEAMMDEVLPFPFAGVDDLKLRWPNFPIDGELRAEVLLEDASQYILDVVPTAASVSANTRKRVVCAVVRRSMGAEDSEMEGVESSQFSAGPHSVSFKPTNPHGDFYLTRQEKISLGHGRQTAFTVSMFGGGTLSHRIWCDVMFGGAICSCGVDS